MKNILGIIIVFILATGVIAGVKGLQSRNPSEKNTQQSLRASPSPTPPAKLSSDTNSSSQSQNDAVKPLVIFLGNNQKDIKSCLQVFPVIREVAIGQKSQLEAALDELLKGPTDNEGSHNYFTNIPPGVKIQGISLRNGVVKVDFSGALQQGVSGICRVAAIRVQINQTLQQFPDVQTVTISVNGQAQNIFQP